MATRALPWLFAAAASAYACRLIVVHATPVDAALPWIAVIVTVMAAASRNEVMIAVPLLMAAEIAVNDETARLLMFGVIVATVFVQPLTRLLRSHPLPLAGEGRREASGEGLSIAIAAILLLRWIPTPAHLGREVVILAIAAATVLVLRNTPFAVAMAVVAALLTPAIPLRTLGLPLAVLAAAVVARFVGMPRIAWTIPSTAVVAFALLFFAWSGVVARAFPFFLRERVDDVPRSTITHAVARGEVAELDVPENARALIVSGANVAHLRRGAKLGRIEPGRIEVRIGDAADWGYLRREVFYGAHNPFPRDSAGRLRGYGYEAWVDGAGRVPLPKGARLIRVTGDAQLPANGSLQVEGFELAR